MPKSLSEMILGGTRPPLLDDAINISIVSDSQLLCEGLVALFSEFLPLCTVTVYTKQDIPDGLPPQPLQLTLMDASADIEKTVELIRTWHAAYPNIAILLLEVVDNASEIMACIEAGAKGYILRGSGIVAVIDALLLLQRGQAVYSLEIVAQIVARLTELSGPSQRSSAVGCVLTEREHEILTYLAADYSNQEIAERLVIEVRTVKHHVHNILAKLKARHRWQAVVVARDQGLIAK